MKSPSFLRAVFGSLALLTLAVPAGAQTTGTIRGTVTDPSGAVIPGAKVAAVLSGTYVTRNTVTDQDGDFVFPSVAVGHYTVVVDAEGFKEFQQRDVEVSIGRVVVINAKMELGALTQVVTTEATAPLIETTSTQLGAVANDRTVSQLPLNARDTYQLLQLQPESSLKRVPACFMGATARVQSQSIAGGGARTTSW